VRRIRRGAACARAGARGADARARRQEHAAGGGEHSNLYVSNLAPEVDDATLAEAFGSCGPITSACVWRDQNTKQRYPRRAGGALLRGSPVCAPAAR
jgi:RNA recognition motif-containing protein